MGLFLCLNIKNMQFIKSFFLHKYIWLTFLSCWITLVLLSTIGSLLYMPEELGWGMILSLICLPLLIKVYKYYSRRTADKGRRFLFSKLGYIVFGIVLGLVILFVIYNFSYQPGWFDFTDLGFVLLSYPLILFTHFEPDSSNNIKRLVLYGIVFVNLVGVTVISDFVGLLLETVFKKIKSLIV